MSNLMDLLPEQKPQGMQDGREKTLYFFIRSSFETAVS